ncbi:hypothetical protein [Commensalibacter nepenthis]|uniref:Uncharacterized protein n=1 Tax=Commensalibacter nepenthis TaxID=3043872 RepID=A0ABT6Q807_9PROT|nr:hypothetical protein [Commensalibacter sp. TBRC 10068]MDI2113038.1 hypothetical protein [Commensalibacter sp. TBRC 10068]
MCNLKENTLYRYDCNVEKEVRGKNLRHDQIVNIYGTTSIYDEDRHGWQEQPEMWLFNASLNKSYAWCGYNADGEISYILPQDAERLMIVSDKNTNNIEVFNSCSSQ